MPKHVDVFISSTSNDLEKYREIAIHVCQRLGLFPIVMEDFPPDPRGAVEYCKTKVDEAEAYLGIYAHRYGWQPFGEKSITEMEYEWAIARGLPTYIFVVDEDTPWSPKLIDKGDAATRLEAFKKQVMGKHIVRKFTDDLDKFKEDMFIALGQLRDDKKPEPGSDIHYVSDIPQPPEPYIAHPYTLHASRLFGWREELNLLTDWVAKPSSPLYSARILNVVAIGGMGKSALTWKWFNEDAPNEIKPLAGRMWWSFYESDAHFENFIIRALAYVSRRSREDIQKNTKPGEREDMLLQILNREPFLLVLDGLERILIAYARMDAARLADDDFDRETANPIIGVQGLLAGLKNMGDKKHQLRKTIDPRAGNFLRKLTSVRASRILISTRLYPADLQTVTGEKLAGCDGIVLSGLQDDDAITLWRELGVSGDTWDLLNIFNSFDNYPLLIRALAGEVASFRRNPGDFNAWHRAHREFTYVLMNLQQDDAKSHVLYYAFKGLDARCEKVLQTLSVFRAPTSYEVLSRLLVKTYIPTEDELDTVLTELEDRGLLGWDRRANRYDIHPLVRSIVWNMLTHEVKTDVYETMRKHFRAMPKDDEVDITSLDDLMPIIELYRALVGLGRHKEAIILFRDRLIHFTHFQLSAHRENTELLELLFTDELPLWKKRALMNVQYSTDPNPAPSNLEAALVNVPSPIVENLDEHRWILNVLALSYDLSGQPGLAILLYLRHNQLLYGLDFDSSLAVGFSNLSDTMRLTGSLYMAEVAARRSLILGRQQTDAFREAVSLYLWGLALAVRNATENVRFSPKRKSTQIKVNPNRFLDSNSNDDKVSSMAEMALELSLHLFQQAGSKQSLSLIHALLAQVSLWGGQYFSARTQSFRAWQFASREGYERDFARIARIQGEAALGLNKSEEAKRFFSEEMTSRNRFIRSESFMAQSEIASPEEAPDIDIAEMAREFLSVALTKSRETNYIQEEISTLVALAELERNDGNSHAAREYIVDLIESAERGTYRLILSDAYNVLAQIERDTAQLDAAVAAATKAYQLAWCDGPPFAYHWGLEKAKAHLDALGAPYPDMPPFDESKYEPMPEVEIDPPDEES